MLIDNDSRTYIPVAIMIVGKKKVIASGSFWISRQYWGKNLVGLRSEIINSPPAANNILKRNPLYLIWLPWIEWSLRRIQNSIFRLTRDRKCRLWTNKLLEISGIKLKFVLENVYDKPKLQPKLQTTKTVINSPYGGKMAASQMRVTMSNNNNSQQITVPTIKKRRFMV